MASPSSFALDLALGTVERLRVTCAPIPHQSSAHAERVRLTRLLGVSRRSPSTDSRIQLVEERLQPTLARLTSVHRQQDLARFRGGGLDRPADQCVTDTRIAGVVALKSQCGIGRWPDDVLCLMDIRQRMRVRARRRNARGAGGGSRSGIADLTCSGMRLHGKGAQPSRALTATGELPDAFNRRTGP